MSELPKGWVEARLGDILLELRNGIAAKPDCQDGLAILRISALRPFELNVLDVRYLPSHATGYQDYNLGIDDLLFTRYNGNPELVGACARVRSLSQRTVYPDKLMRARIDGQIANPCFVEYAANVGDSRAYIRSKGKTAAGQVGISGADLRLTPISLPPLAEQRRIVAKLDELLARCRRAKEELAEIPALLERYRQSVLAAAFRGDLTVDWREKNPDVEPASELLKRIRVERRRRWEEAELARLTAKGRAPTDERWKERYEEPIHGDPVNNAPLLPHWTWASVDEISLNLDGARIPVKAEDRVRRQGQYSYYGASGVIDSIDDYLFDGKYLLVAEDGANLLSRNTPIAFEASGRFWVNNHAHVLDSIVPISYLRHRLNGMDIRTSVSGSAQPKLTQKNLLSLQLPIGPIEEMVLIAKRLDEMADRERQVLSVLNSQVSQIEALERAILTRAFRGELVPQDPANEPASVLMERIRAEREAAPVKKKSGRQPRRDA